MIDELSETYKSAYRENKVILSFDQFLEQVKLNPKRYIRNSAKYIVDMFDHFGKREVSYNKKENTNRFNIFDEGTEKDGPIIGGELVQNEIYNHLKSFVKQGHNSKLILLHGPNGAAKSSTFETIARFLEKYSHQDEGAIYRFNWIFSNDKYDSPLKEKPIGFDNNESIDSKSDSYAFLEENKISSKIGSEFKENPLFLLPMPYREKVLREWIADKQHILPEEVVLPPSILKDSLFKKNQLIFENLLNAYKGDLKKVYQHIQVERFFCSRQYRVGVAVVEPQMAVDAHQKQLTMDQNYANLPPVLQTISFYQSEGDLIEANRGLLEYSDLLKRPVDAFKYLLTTIEKGTINLPSGNVNLDLVFMATTNDKYLNSFKESPDFSSFKGRIELIKSPYLLLPSLERQIYDKDLEIIKKIKTICPHSVELLCSWAVMTRYLRPSTDVFEPKYHSAIDKLDPFMKMKFYEGENLQPEISIEEQNSLESIRKNLVEEYNSGTIYEGILGASPREIKSILYRVAYQKKHDTLTPMAVIEELEHLIDDRSVYDFLKIKPDMDYHDVDWFLRALRDDFLTKFKTEVIRSMCMADDTDYDELLKRYVDNVVAEIKKENIYDKRQ
jgi:predicted Ser/Thr protein kinase